MSLFTVDDAKCDRCGICLEECPFYLLEIAARDAVPTPVEVLADERCINCGHCMAVCPNDALMLKEQAPEDFALILPQLKTSREQVTQLLMARRTVRSYENRTVPLETIAELIRVACHAPSGHNNQMAQWFVISDRSQIKQLGQTVIDWMKSLLETNPLFGRMLDADIIIDYWEKGVDTVFRGAPHVIIIHGPASFKDLPAIRTQLHIRLAYFDLIANSFGLGTVWGGYFMAAYEAWPPAHEAIGLPEGNCAYDCMAFGYPKNQFRRIPVRNEPQITWR